MAPPQPRKGPVRVPQNPLMGGVLGNQMPSFTGAFSPPPPAAPAGSPLTGVASNFYQSPQVPLSPLSTEARGQMLADNNRQNRGMESLIGQIQGLTRQSQIQNPLLPSSPTAGVPTLRSPAAQSQMDFMQRQESARQLNTRLGDFSQSAGQQYVNNLSLRPDDMRDRLASRDAAMQPGGVQMQRRFAPASPLGQEADYYRRGQQGVDAGEGVFIQPGGYGSPQQYLGFNNTREGAEQTAIAMAERRATDRTAPGFRSEEQRAAQLQQGLDRRKAAIAAGLPKQRAEAKKAALQDRTLKRAVMRGMNPLSPQAQALYPEAVGRLRAARSGGQAAPANPLRTGPGGTVTAQDKANARTIARGLVHGIPGPPDKDGNPTPGSDGNPFLQQIKVTGDLDAERDIGSLHQGMVANLESSNPVTPSVEDLRAIQGYMNSIKTEHGDDATKLPQTFIKSPPIAMFQHRWDELAKMPANASDKELMDWYAKFASTDRRGMSIF